VKGCFSLVLGLAEALATGTRWTGKAYRRPSLFGAGACRVRYRLLVGPRKRISTLSASKQLVDVQSRKNRRDKGIELTVQMVGLW
jgi:hypothetical protein